LTVAAVATTASLNYSNAKNYTSGFLSNAKNYTSGFLRRQWRSRLGVVSFQEADSRRRSLSLPATPCLGTPRSVNGVYRGRRSVAAESSLKSIF